MLELLFDIVSELEGKEAQSRSKQRGGRERENKILFNNL